LSNNFSERLGHIYGKSVNLLHQFLKILVHVQLTVKFINKALGLNFN
jgi:hypothetical protein